jgi:hypothetical protein
MIRPASKETGGAPVPEEPLVRRVMRRSSAASGRWARIAVAELLRTDAANAVNAPYPGETVRFC